MLLVTVGLVMAAMMVGMAIPVFADSPWTEEQGNCRTKQGKPGGWFTRFTNHVKVKRFVDPTQFARRQ